MCLLKKICRIEKSTKKKIKFNSNSPTQKFSSDNNYSAQDTFYNGYSTCPNKAHVQLTYILNCKMGKHISILKKNYFIFGCAGSSLLCMGFLWSQQAGATLQLWCADFSLRWLLLLQSMGSRSWGFSSEAHGLNSCGLGLQIAGSVVVAVWLSCFKAYGIFLDQGLNLHPLHCKMDSYQGSPILVYLP